MIWIFFLYHNRPSTGNASDFGDTTDARYAIAGASSSVRAVFGGGRTSGGSVEIS